MHHRREVPSADATATADPKSILKEIEVPFLKPLKGGIRPLRNEQIVYFNNKNQGNKTYYTGEAVRQLLPNPPGVGCLGILCGSRHVVNQNWLGGLNIEAGLGLWISLLSPLSYEELVKNAPT